MRLAAITAQRKLVLRMRKAAMTLFLLLVPVGLEAGVFLLAFFSARDVLGHLLQGRFRRASRPFFSAAGPARGPEASGGPRRWRAAVLPPCGQRAVLQPAARGRHLGSGLSRTRLTFSRWREKEDVGIRGPVSVFSTLPESSPTPAPPDGIFRGGSGAVHRGCGVSSTASGARGGVCERRAGGGGGSGGPSLKNKLWSGNKLGALHAEESKKIQAQLKELHYGKKDLIFKAQQLTDLEQKLSVAKDKLENAALDKESQLKALKETVQLCLCSVLRSQPPAASLISSKPAEKLPSSNAKGSQAPSQGTSTKSVRSWNGPLPQGSTGHCWAGVEITAGWDIDGGVGLETLGHELKCCRAGAEAKITPVMLEKRRAGAGRRDLAVK
ncbi:uncharacterized protein [Taeniopygia guttata]|uniref:uncharacterized protein n=1 Tax=Taeniopygia guttata TaxID=59729 RepID=UPI003BB8E235